MRIPTWRERCEAHPDHAGIVTGDMLRARMQEEIDDLRSALEQRSRRKQAQRIADLDAEVDRWMAVAKVLQGELIKARANPWPTVVRTEAA